MYSWLWRHLPGGVAGKLFGCTALLLGVVVLLFLVVFPWAEPRLPFNNVTVEPDTPASGPATPGGSATPGVTPTP